MNIKKNEFEDLIFCSFRYALGRRTYIVSTVAEIILKHKDVITNNTKHLMIKEILEAVEKNQAGMDCDVHMWKTVVDELRGV